MKTPNHATDAQIFALTCGNAAEHALTLPPLPTLREHMRESARAYLLAVLERHRRRGDAAAAAGLNRTDLYRVCRKYGIELDPMTHRGAWGDL